MKRKIQKITHPALLASIILGALCGLAMVPARASGGWTCPIDSVQVGTCTCTSAGCERYGGDGYWVCKFNGSGPNCSCPPLNACEETLID